MISPADLSLGLAFYPQHDYPIVPCSFCPTRHETTLFWIRGIDHGQHEPTIPSKIFEVLECVKSEPIDHESLALEARALNPNQLMNFAKYGAQVHYRGATAAAKLFATQTRVAIELLHKSKQCIKTLERENELLKARLQNMSRSPLTHSHKDFRLPSPKTCQAVSPDWRESSRLTLKRPFQLSSSPMVRNTRVCLPERGVLHAYGTRRLIDFHHSPMTSRELELDIRTSPAFSTPCLRTNPLARSSLPSPYQRRPIIDTPRMVQEIEASIEGLGRSNAQKDRYVGGALKLRRTENDWFPLLK